MQDTLRIAGLSDGLDVGDNGASVSAEGDFDIFALVMGWKGLLFTDLV